MMFFDDDDDKDYEAGDTKECDSCDGDQQWCTLCQVFTATCHETFGTCGCS